jgi:uncharacterized protein YqgV (UPF0045/DUF77 family)
MIIEIQCLPNPPGTATDRWAHVDAAIAVIQHSGLHFEVGPLGTSVEGEPDAIWPLLRAVHEATLAAGADGVVSVIKVEQTREVANDPSMLDLVGKFRS